MSEVAKYDPRIAQRLPIDPLPVSVVIPAYRRADLIIGAVRSALSQEPPPVEVIVVDDCSGDDTPTQAAAAGAKVLFHDVNVGQGTARNTGVAAAISPWIAFLDSDDEWDQGHLDYLWRHRDDHVLVAAAGRGSSDGRVYGHPGPLPLQLRTPADVIVPFNRVAPSGVLVRKDALIAAGGFRKLRHAEDLDAWIRLLEHGSGVALPKVTFQYRQHPGQVSADLIEMSAGLDFVVGSYAGRPWWSRRVHMEAQAMPRWDQMMAARNARHWGKAARFGAGLAAPNRMLGLVRLLVVRRRLAHRRATSMTSHF